MVLVMTPGALESEIVRKEWRLARQRGFCVVSVFGAPHLDMWSLPDWMGDTHFVDTANPEQWKRLLRQFEGPREGLRAPLWPMICRPTSRRSRKNSSRWSPPRSTNAKSNR